MVPSGKSFVSWWAAAESARRSLPTACTSICAAESPIRPPRWRTSDSTNRANSDGFRLADFTSVTDLILRSLLSRPEPFWPPECTSTSPTSSTGASA